MLGIVLLILLLLWIWRGLDNWDSELKPHGAFQCRGVQPASVRAVLRPVAWWPMRCSRLVLELVRLVVNT